MAYRLPDAAEVFVDVVDQAADDQLLDGHRRHVRQHRPATRELLVTQRPDCRGGHHRARREELNRLRPRAVSVLLRVPGIHLVDHGAREAARRLPGRHRPHHVRDRLEGAGDVVGGHPHRPPLGVRHLRPVPVVELLQDGHGVMDLRLEAPRERFALRSHRSTPFPETLAIAYPWPPSLARESNGRSEDRQERRTPAFLASRRSGVCPFD
jgi:hypothetical protein